MCAVDFDVLPTVRVLDSGFLTIVENVGVVSLVVGVAVHAVLLVVNFVVVVVFVSVLVVNVVGVGVIVAVVSCQFYG